MAEDKVTLEELIPGRTSNFWTGLSRHGPLNRLAWSKKIWTKFSSKLHGSPPVEYIPPLEAESIGSASMFSLESETSITFVNKNFLPNFYKSNSIICIYTDQPKADEEDDDEDDDEDDEEDEGGGNYKQFITAILGLDGAKENVSTIVEDIFGDLLNLNKISDITGDEYYENLKKELLKIIERVTGINLVLTILPKKYDIDKISILVGSNFDNNKNTLGLNIYSDKYYTNSGVGSPEKLDINLLTLLEEKMGGEKLKLDYNLKNVNEVFEKINNPVPSVITKEMVINPDPVSKLIELCNGKEITDHYFSDWNKIEIEQIKNTKMNTFLVEPKTTNKHNRKLLSYSKEDDKPSRFAGYFRQLGDEECEIIWDPEWEVKYIIDDETQYSDPVDVTSDDIALRADPLQDSYSEQLNKLHKLGSFENEITKVIKGYKMYNLQGDQGNCFFYSFANSLIVSNIINFEEDYPDLIHVDTFEKLQKENRLRPVYKILANKLKILSHDIIEASFHDLHTHIKEKNDSGTLRSFLSSTDTLSSDQQILKERYDDRESLVEINDSLGGEARETEIKIQVSNYLQKLKKNKFSGSSLEFEALCAFFNINGGILTMINKSKLSKKIIDKTHVLKKFILDGIRLDNRIDPVPVDDLSDKTIYLSLIDNHYISTIRWTDFRKTSYNYLFQNNELEVSINYPKGTYNKLKVTDFHMGSTMAAIINNTFLEGCHNYIQWLFPNMQISEQVQSAQRHIYWKGNGPLEVSNQLILNSDDVKFIKSTGGDAAKLNSIKSLMTIMKFFGFKFVVVSDTGNDDLELTDYPNFEKKLPYIKLERLSDDEYKERFTNLLEKSHNYSRISRILKYFNVIGLNKLSKIILDKLTYEIEGDAGELKGNDEIQRSLTKFWKNIY